MESKGTYLGREKSIHHLEAGHRGEVYHAGLERLEEVRDGDLGQEPVHFGLGAPSKLGMPVISKKGHHEPIPEPAHFRSNFHSHLA